MLLRYHPLTTHLIDKVSRRRDLASLGGMISCLSITFNGICPSTLQLLVLLGDPDLGPAVADGFALLMSDSPDVLGKSCHAEVRLMFRQRFFTECVPQLVQGFHTAAPGKNLSSPYLAYLELKI